MAKLNLMDLKNDSIRVQNEQVTISNDLLENSLELSELVPQYNGFYSIRNKTVCFISNNEIYVTPYTRSVLKTLKVYGFTEANFIVPFENGDYPKFERFKWKNLREKAALTYIKDFEEDCLAYSKAHNIGKISSAFLKNSLEIPSTGIRVSHSLYDLCYCPIIAGYNFDFVAINNIGKFCANNDKVIFVYRNGKTYVTKGYKIIPELLDAGYKEGYFSVPFGKGEKILDPVIRDKWESIKKLSLVD